jgi:hypothetical protein
MGSRAAQRLRTGHSVQHGCVLCSVHRLRLLKKHGCYSDLYCRAANDGKITLARSIHTV